jgi:mono/diheme cytochrome c family protein
MMNTHCRNIRTAFGIAFAGLVMAGLTSCGKADANSPGVEFMPDMYRSPSLEYYQAHVIGDDTLMNAMQPVAGTVARGYIPYAYPNSTEGYTAAAASLKSPLDMSNRAKWEEEGAVLYGKFCVHCHGASGGGDGKVGGKLPGPPPAYSSLQGLTEGRIFHVITFGKGMMGPHNSQLNSDERWKIVTYVQKLAGQGSAAAPADSTKAGAAPTATAGEGGNTSSAVKEQGKK